MQLQFDPNQDFQITAITSAVRVFAGQRKQSALFSVSLHPDDNSPQNGHANILNIPDTTLYNNVQGIQVDNKIQTHTTDPAPRHFTIEMETGTGKTYVYLRTIFEMHKQYGFSKFCIVVPSVAIREGVLKSLQIMHNHFLSLYDNVDYGYFVYDGNKLSKLRQFATASTLQVMVINIDAFNKDSNKMHTFQEKLQGVPIEFIQRTHPIVIIDEPQNMESDKAKTALNTLHPLATFRYSATHITKHNPLFVLNAVHAYNRKLVKQIEVSAHTTANDHNTAYIRVLSTDNKNNVFTARIEVDKHTATGIHRNTITVKKGDDLYKKTKRECYQGYVIDDIYHSADMQYINFTNQDDVIQQGQAIGDIDTNHIKYQQIYDTISIHLEKQLNCHAQKVKVLSLFFIDKVANYRIHNDDGTTTAGKFVQFFEKAFKDIISKNPKYHDLYNVDDIPHYHDGYFSKDSKGKIKDTKGTTNADNDSYSLIMKDKEKLLSFDTKLQFIFSHSALREGWDNPNVFQICTLNDTTSTLKKRQEIGRGLRLCVDQFGNRRRDLNLNVLTVVANESYDSFADSLQQELEQETGVTFEKSHIKNRAERKIVKLNKQVLLSEDFKQLWDKIRQKTYYTIRYDTAQLLQKCQQHFADNPLNIHKTAIRKHRTRLDITTAEGVQADTQHMTTTEHTLNTHTAPPDIIYNIQQRVHLNRKTIVDILIQSGQLDKCKINPQHFTDTMVDIINQQKQRLLVDGVKYTKKQQYYTQDLFQYKDLAIYLKDQQLPENCIEAHPEKHPYQVVVCDSGYESAFAKECNANTAVKVFTKLPFWFKIPTPIGTYNPDWAVLIDNDGSEKLYFVVETKGTTDINKLRPKEQQKIHCGTQHFNAIRTTNALKYRLATQLSDIL